MNSMKLAIALAAIASTGCAQLTTFNRSVDLKASSLAIDAKQRVIFSKEKETVAPINGSSTILRNMVICAEPSPDALAVLGASGALSISNPSKIGGSASGGIAEAAASIGLRTQSIQLLRDLNYRICEAYSNDALKSGEAATLLRRGQSTMMGLIAIEQLTGPVVAAQVALSSSGSSGTGLAEASSDLSSAQTAVTNNKKSYLDAIKNQDTSQTAYKEKEKELGDARAKLAAESKKPADQKDAEKIEQLRNDITAAEKSLSNAQDDLKDKKRRVKSAEEDLKTSEERLTSTSNGKTNAGSQGKAEIATISKDLISGKDGLIKGVTDIVKTVNANYFREGCFSFMSDLVNNPSLVKEINSAAEHETSSQNDKVSVLAIVKTTLKTCNNLFITTASGGEEIVFEKISVPR